MKTIIIALTLVITASAASATELDLSSAFDTTIIADEISEWDSQKATLDATKEEAKPVVTGKGNLLIVKF